MPTLACFPPDLSARAGENLSKPQQEMLAPVLTNGAQNQVTTLLSLSFFFFFFPKLPLDCVP